MVRTINKRMMEGKRNVAKRSNTTSFSQTKHKV
jgi:hypothetical protein